MANYYTIHLSGRFEKKQSLHAAAGETIKPGMVIEQATLTSDSAVGTVQAQSTEGGNDEVWIAYEDALQGDIVTDTFTAGEVVDSGIELPGAEFQGLLAAGTNYSALAKLQFAGDGTFEVVDTGTAKAILLEAVDLSDSTATATLAKMRRI